ncbi:MAG: RNA 2',3'-cyclic phosphodiesterase [Burkholderiales bacterium]
MRLFFALWPPREAASALHAWATRACRQTGGRVTRAETIHLTLAFLGEIEASRISSLKSIGRASGGKAHVLPIEQARYWKHNGIVWAGPNEIPAPLAALDVDLRNNLEREGFSLESRAFAAHVTLIRKAREPGAALPGLPGVDWPVSEFVLVRSALAREGSSYRTIERFALDQR